MSAALLGLAWGARMGERSRKLILMKLVDCCRDDGKQIFPAVRSVAEGAECSPRQVQKVMAEFCAVGLLRKVRDGGCGPKSTACYEMDIALLRRIASAGYDVVRAEAGYAENAELEPEQVGDDAADKGEPGAPLEPARANGATDKGERAVHPTPKEEPLNREREREGAQGRESDGEGGGGGEPCVAGHARLPDFLSAWPTAAFDDRGLIERAWGALAFDERDEALACVPGYLDALKKAGRTKVPAGQSYLGEKRWLLLGEKAGARGGPARAVGAGFLVEPMSREWWAILFDRVKRRAPCGLMVQWAYEKRAYLVPDAERPGPEALSALTPRRSTGPEMAAWADWLRRAGVNLPRFREEFWVFLPGDAPGKDGAI